MMSRAQAKKRSLRGGVSEITLNSVHPEPPLWEIWMSVAKKGPKTGPFKLMLFKLLITNRR